MKTILITGVTGMLGKDIAGVLAETANIKIIGIVRSIKQQCPGYELQLCDLSDILKLQKLVKEINPDVIIHCAAVVDLDECEKNHLLANAVHVEATDVLSRFNVGHTRFIYISTDSVFNGEGGPYSEEDPTNPINYYALSKRNGENVALQNNPYAVVLRTNIYGFHIPIGKSLGEWAINSLRSGECINGFTDVFFNPLYTKQVATIVIKYFLSNNRNNIWHLGTKESLSKYDFVKMIAKQFGFDEKLVNPLSIKGFKFSTPRPKSTILDVSKLYDSVLSRFNLSDGLYDYCKDYNLLRNR